MSFDSVAAALTGGKSGGRRCGQCPALKAEVRRLKAKIKRYEVIMANAHAVAVKYENAGKDGLKKPSPPIDHGKFKGWAEVGGKIRKII